MKTNIGDFDRIMRFALGITLLGSGLFLWGGLGSIAGIVGVVLGAVMLGTCAMGVCLLYLPFGINTCKTKNS